MKNLIFLTSILLLAACGRPKSTNDFSGTNAPREAVHVTPRKPAPPAQTPETGRREAPAAPAAASPVKPNEPVLKGTLPGQSSAPEAPATARTEAPRPETMPMTFFAVSNDPPHEVPAEHEFALTPQQVDFAAALEEIEKPEVAPKGNPQDEVQELETPAPVETARPARPKPAPVRVAKPQAPRENSGGASGMEKRLLELLNQARAQRGLSPLRFNRTQSDGTSNCIGARGHSEYMAQRGTISHDNFPRNVCLRSGASAENVAFASGDESRALETVHRSLMNSPGHYANIMNPNYNTVGLGFFYYKNRLYVTQVFLRL